MVIIEVDIYEEIKKLETERDITVKMANININRIDGAIALLKKLDERNKETVKEEDNKRLE